MTTPEFEEFVLKFFKDRYYPVPIMEKHGCNRAFKFDHTQGFYFNVLQQLSSKLTKGFKLCYVDFDAKKLFFTCPKEK